MIEDRIIAGWRRVVRFLERFTGPYFEADGKVITYSEMTPEQRAAFDQVTADMGKAFEAMAKSADKLAKATRTKRSA